MRGAIRVWAAIAAGLVGCAPAGDPCGAGACGASTGEPGTTGEAETTTGGPSGPTTSGEGSTAATNGEGSTEAPTSGVTSGSTGGEPAPSAGCGLAPLHAAGGVQVEIDAGPAGDGARGFFLSLPADYDPNVPHRLVLGYPGTNWVGAQIQSYLDLEDGAAKDEIFVYPDPLWRDFPGWGNYGGWLLGPHAAPADGEQDLAFTAAILDYMAAHYCVDPDRVFVTGHSWGGDMAMVVACFLGERVRAAVPVAANRPYWFEPDGGGVVDCPGAAAVWTMFGIADDHFTSQDYPGQYGDECRDFWLGEAGCAGVDQAVDLGLGAAMECVEYVGCDRPTRYCLYGAAFGHQRPDYYPAATMAFFRGF